MSYVIDTLSNLLHQTAFFNLTWGNYLMIAVACVFLFLAIAKGFEPLLLVPAWCSSTAWYLCSLLPGNPDGIQRKSSSSDLHHRWC